MKNKLFFCCLVLFLNQAQLIGQYDVGVFYMPFWHYSNGSQPTSGNWGMIEDYTNWQMLNGQSHNVLKPQSLYSPSSYWYDEKQQHVVEKQHELMANNGIDFVIYDSYFERRGNGFGPFWTHAMENVIKPGFNNHGVDFSIAWWNDFLKLVHGGYCDEFLRGGGLDDLAAHFKTYMQHPNYKKKNGKPVLFIGYPGYQVDPTYGDGIHTNSLEGLCGYCETDPFFAATPGGNVEPYINHRKTKYFLDMLEAKIGLGDIHFVLVIWGVDGSYNEKYDWMVRHPNEAGFDAVTSYGYKRFWASDASTSYDYSTMMDVHVDFYNYMLNSNGSYLNNNNLKYYVPVSSGWNRAPFNKFECDQGTFWGDCNQIATTAYQSYLGHDNAVSTPYSWSSALTEVKNRLDLYPTETDQTAILCCWNEYAEGTVIEPTTKWGSQYLQEVKNTFDNPFTDPFGGGFGGLWGWNRVDASGDTETAQPLMLKEQTMSVYPNPADEKIMLSHQLQSSGSVRITMYDVLGTKIREVLNKEYVAGQYQFPINVSTLSNGVYFLEVETGEATETIKFNVKR